tara:strand:- start:6201 stop:6572 length:372 start_codon:yes stop_codon:yes gene_type:complete
MGEIRITRAEVARDVYYAIARAADKGAKAPTEQEMARLIGVVNSTVHNAIKTLVAGHLIERRKVQSRPLAHGGTGHQIVYRIVATGAETEGFSTLQPVAPPWPRVPRASTIRPAMPMAAQAAE